MKEIKWKSLGWLAMCVCALMFVSCSDDDSGSGNGQEVPTETTDPNSPVWGEWEGSGTTIAGKKGSMTLKLYSDGTGSMVVSASSVIVVKYIQRFYYSGSHISITFKDDAVFILLGVESLTSTTMQVLLTDCNDAVWGTYNLTKTGSGERGSSGGRDDGGGSSDTSREKCRYCHGSGKCHNYTAMNSDEYYCGGDGKCYNCDGKGYYWYSPSRPNVKCGICNGSGKCKQCGGTGKCSECGGTGYQ